MPTVTVYTAAFLAGGRMQAAAVHMPDYALICVPQHYITRAAQEVRHRANACLDEMLARRLSQQP
jgi:BarA-like signal transduction histidine kinase